MYSTCKGLNPNIVNKLMESNWAINVTKEVNTKLHDLNTWEKQDGGKEAVS